MKRQRDKDKCTNYHDKEKKRNQGKEKTIETNIGEVILMRQIGDFNKYREGDNYKEKVKDKNITRR